MRTHTIQQQTCTDMCSIQCGSMRCWDPTRSQPQRSTEIHRGPQRSTEVRRGPQRSTEVHRGPEGPQRYTEVHRGREFTNTKELSGRAPKPFSARLALTCVASSVGICDVWISPGHNHRGPQISRRSTEVHRGPERSTEVHRGPERSREVHRDTQRSTEGHRGPQRSTKVHRGPQRSRRSTEVHRGPQRSRVYEYKGALWARTQAIQRQTCTDMFCIQCGYMRCLDLTRSQPQRST